MTAAQTHRVMLCAQLMQDIATTHGMTREDMKAGALMLYSHLGELDKRDEEATE